MFFLGKPNTDLQIYISQALFIHRGFGFTVGFMHAFQGQLFFKYAHIPRPAQARSRIPRFYPGPGFIHDRARIEPGSGLNRDRTLSNQDASRLGQGSPQDPTSFEPGSSSNQDRTRQDPGLNPGSIQDLRTHVRSQAPQRLDAGSNQDQTRLSAADFVSQA